MFRPETLAIEFIRAMHCHNTRLFLWIEPAEYGVISHFRKPLRRNSAFCSSMERDDVANGGIFFDFGVGAVGFFSSKCFCIAALNFADSLMASSRSSWVSVSVYCNIGGPRKMLLSKGTAERICPGLGNTSAVLIAFAQPASICSGLRSARASK